MAEHLIVNKDVFLNENKIVSLKDKSKNELKQMLDRQEKLLINKKFINSLPDKGEKIRIKRDELANELKIRENIDETESILEKLSLGQIILPQHPTFTCKKEIKVENIEDDDDRKDLFAKILTKNFEDKEKENKISNRLLFNRCKNKNDNQDKGYIDKSKMKNYYSDTALKIDENDKQIVTLSIDESIKLGEQTKLKENQIKQRILLNKLALFQESSHHESNLDEEEDI